MNTTTNSIFANVGAAKVARKKDQYFTDGDYIAEVQDVKITLSTKPGSVGQRLIFVQFSILEVTKDKGTWTNSKGEEVSSAAPGDLCTFCIKLSWRNWEQTWKNFLCSAANFTESQAAAIPDDQWTEFAEKACYHLGDEIEAFDPSEWAEQPLKGAQVKVYANTIKTDQGYDFTKLIFEAV